MSVDLPTSLTILSLLLIATLPVRQVFKISDDTLRAWIHLDFIMQTKLKKVHIIGLYSKGFMDSAAALLTHAPQNIIFSKLIAPSTLRSGTVNGWGLLNLCPLISALITKNLLHPLKSCVYSTSVTRLAAANLVGNVDICNPSLVQPEKGKS